jgi:undecaprenyl-diphosphatase
LSALPIAVAFSLLAVAVESTWDPFRGFDQRAATRLCAQAVTRPAWTHAMAFVFDAGGPTTFRVLVGVLAVVLRFPGARRLALWAASTMAAGTLLDTVLKSAVGRVRPSLPNPVAHAPGASFPSGHALTATFGLRSRPC